MPELIWKGKYDEKGRRVAPSKIALPFQTVETVNESTQDRDRTRSLFAESGKTEWRNRLIWGDKKYVLPSLLPELAGSVNLIYIDPPFDTGADFSFTAQIPDDPNVEDDQSQSFVKQPSILELKAYRDIWGTSSTHLDSYLKWFSETVAVLYDLLAPNGSIYVHLDYRLIHHCKTVLDEIFTTDNFKNEIVWRRTGSNTSPSRYGNNCDFILFYTKSEKYTWNQMYGEYDPEYIKSHYTQLEADGRRFQLVSTTGAGATSKDYQWKGMAPPRGRHWAYSKEKMEELDQSGRLVYSKSGMPRVKYYLDEQSGPPLQCLWNDIKTVNSQATERIDYPTQKPEALLERIIKASSNESDLVLDCFCGSGTTASVAEKLGRRWITCDLGRFAIHTARKRLLGIADVKPFVVQNLGKYERQAWQVERVKNDESSTRSEEEIAQIAASRLAQRNYIEFMLKLYRARPLDGFLWLHGVRDGRYVHVGGVDSPVSDGDLKQIAAEFRRAVGSGADAPANNGIDVLGWDFAFETNEAARQSAAQSNVDMRFKLIPREVMERRAAEQGDIQFFELAALNIEYSITNREVTLQLAGFAIPPDYVPADVQSQITHWEQLVDYWAIDWDNKGVLLDTFHNQWQSYRTRASKKLERQSKHVYDTAGTYRIVVKAIDILGNDTTKVLKIVVE